MISLSLLQTIVGCVCGGSFMGLVQFLISRHDDKAAKNDAVLIAINNLDRKIAALDRKIDQVQAKGDERNAVSARVRLLQFEDELQAGRRHSKDSWDQAISDCDEYESHYRHHPEFKNGIADATIDHIRKEYMDRLKKHDFL